MEKHRSRRVVAQGFVMKYIKQIRCKKNIVKQPDDRAAR